MARPSGQDRFKSSLVSFGVKLFPATEAKSEIRFHQLSRKTGERIHHQKFDTDEGPVEKDEIVKGYEYRKGQYVTIEPEEIEHLRIPSRHTLAVEQFVNERRSPLLLRKTLLRRTRERCTGRSLRRSPQSSSDHKKSSPRKNRLRWPRTSRRHRPTGRRQTPRHDGLHHALRRRTPRPRNYFDDIKKVSVDEDQLSLAKELIKRKSAKFNPDKFNDEYEAALKELVEAKVKKEPLPTEEPAPKTAKVINLMDALRKSVRGDIDSTKKAPAASGKGLLCQTKTHRKKAAKSA